MANTLRFKRGLVSGIPTAALGEPLFTTDTFDLYIGNGTGNTRFQKYIASGATTQILRGDGSLYTFPLAISSPSAGQVLKYNGTSWVNDSDAGITGSGSSGQVAYFTGATTQGGSNNLFWDATNNRLGIGTNAPNNKTHIVSTSIGAESIGLRIQNADTTANTSAAIDFAMSTDLANLGSTAKISAIRLSLNNTALRFITSNAGTLNEGMRLTNLQNLLIGSTTDNGLRFQVTGDGYFSGSVGIGSTSISNINLRLSKTITGSATSHAVFQEGVVQTDVTTTAYGFRNIINTANSLTLGEYIHFYVQQGTIGTSNAITNQYGYSVGSNLTSATNNFGFYGNIASGTGRWNLYMNGSAANYLAGRLGINTTTPETFLHVNGSVFIGGVSTIGLQLENALTSIPSSNVRSIIANTSSSIVVAGALLLQPRTGVAAPILFSTEGTEKMRLDASGNLGLGVVPSAWSLSGSSALQVRNTSLYGVGNDGGLVSNAYFNTGFGGWFHIASARAARYDHTSGNHQWFTSTSGTAGTAVAFTQAMTLDASGNLAVGTTTTTNRLEVWGSGNTAARIVGQSAGNATLILSSGGVTAYSIKSGNGDSSLRIDQDGTERIMLASGGNLLIGTTTNSTFKLDVNGTMRVSGGGTARSTIIQTTTDNHLVLTTTNSGGDVYSLYENSADANNAWAIGRDNGGNFRINQSTGATYPSGTTTSHLTIASTGAATFSSSVTAGGSLYASGYSGVPASSSVVQIGFTGGAGYIQSSINGATAPISIDGSTFAVRTGTYTTALTINSSQAATFSSSIQAATAIAIGTTPDTNKPFKVLKNINGTVGINFENTSTGSSAFSAIQMGTDVSGGTKFTNLVYASSGVTASGVYNPDGTSLINNGNGGLNFLGNPIRMYTGGSNGTLRWDMTNDGFITQYTGTNPSTNATDGYRQYSADVVAGNAAPHFRTENGAIIKLYQETTAVGNSTISVGGGNAVLDDTEFDGYTLRQIVRALRNQGILQ